MSKHVLIIATSYDAAASYTHEWAQKLRDDLIIHSSCSSCLMLDGETLRSNGPLLADAIQRADFVVFYGHGEIDKWLALPAKGALLAVSLIDGGSIQVLDGRQVYAACCHSLHTLGSTFAHTFQNRSPVPDFVGYLDAFDFSIENREEFRRIVHDSVRDYILGSNNAATIVSNQSTAWQHLDSAFSSGVLKTRSDAIFAASCARSNALAIGNK
jgi:hypothetical protein